MSAADARRIVDQTVDGAIYAVLVDEFAGAHQMLAEAQAAGLTSDLISRLVGTAAGLVQQLAELQGEDPAESWGEFIRSRP